MIIMIFVLSASYTYQKSKLLILDKISKTTPYHTIIDIEGKRTGMNSYEFIVEYSYLSNSGKLAIRSLFSVKHGEIVDGYRID